MPPVFGPGVAVADPLEVLGRRQRDRRPPSHTANTDTSGPVRPSSITTRRPASPNAAPGQLVPHVVLGLGQRLGDEHALAGGQPVGLHDVEAGERAQERERRLDVRERLVAGGGHAGGGQRAPS